MEVLDVTQLEPKRKHPTIFEKFSLLKEGDALIISNDHDPIPLYYQMIAELGPIFEWQYLLKGPDIFEVKISKLSEGAKSETIGSLVAEDFRKAEVFKKFGLDFCCGGKNTVKEACDKKGIDFKIVEKELDLIDQKPKTREGDYINWKLDFLIDYILNNHHAYVTNTLPFILELSNKVSNVHGDSHPELIKINEILKSINSDLKYHMLNEEQKLFPYVKELVKLENSGSKIDTLSLEPYLSTMEVEHETVGNLLNVINKLTNGYSIPVDACNSFKVLYGNLEEFEMDLHQHVHLENNILFPKALLLEEKLLQK